MSTPFEPIKIADVVWRDGIPYAIDFEDIYFSIDGGLAEAEHVFVEGNQLIPRWQALAKDKEAHFVIAETGFGSGLNFLLTWFLWQKQAPSTARLHFISCEKHPLSREDLTACLALWPSLQPQATELIAAYPILTPGFHHLQFEDGRVNLTLMLGDALSSYRELLLCGDAVLESALREYAVDAWFLDGFSPAKNPMMWHEPLFMTIGMLSKKGTTIATYSAASIVKQGLKKAGFKVGKRPGFGQKRDMVVAEFEQLPLLSTRPRHTPWHVSTPKAINNKRAIIIGAGLAGCYTAYALARRGWSVTLLDAKERVGCGASGNRQAVLYPKLSSFSSPLNAFMLSAYLFAIRTYPHFLKQSSMGELSGMLQLAYSPKETTTQTGLQHWLAHYPSLGTLVDAEQASAIAGVALQSGGLFMPHSGWLDSPALCQWLIEMPGIAWVPQTPVTAVSYEAHEWHVNEYHAEVLVIANGYQATQFAQTNHLPLKPIRGQMSTLLSNDQSNRLRVPLCADGHIIPALEGGHALGATYHLGSDDNACYEEDDALNLAKLKALSTTLPWSHEVTGHWAGVRAATPDYLPLVGPVADATLFKEQFAGLESNSKRWIPASASHHEGLYICAGFGSRGLTTIPLSAEWLAATINKEPSILPRALVQSMSPARFLRREIMRGK